MSRHRNIRKMNYNDECEGFDDVYGHSVDDDSSCISPTDSSQFLFDRDRQQNMSAFLASHRDIQEENENETEAEIHDKRRRDSENFQFPKLNDEDHAKLLSCIDEIRNVVGDFVSERQLVETIMQFNYDVTKALDVVLNTSITPPSQLKQQVPMEITPKVNLGIDSSLLGRYTQPTIPIATVANTINTRRGFNINSPDTSPIASPEPQIFEIKSKVKENYRNAEELFNKERGDGKSHIHMVVIGHVDAGKSTLLGHLLCDLGNVPQRVMHKHEQESKKMGKQSFMYAWVLDETCEERTRGITMDVGSCLFETKSKLVTILDAPGHKDFIPNMISGATQADVALLVVDATRGEFETGFEQGGQTREHALLVRSLGVNQLGVVINKLDTVNWSKIRFDEIISKLRTFLKQAGFKESDITYIPCSGLTGENLVKPTKDSELNSWYDGPTLLDVIDKFKTPERAIEKTFRMSVSDIYKGTGSNFCVSGRIETGVLCVNDKVLVGTTRELVQVKGITMDDFPQNSVFAGDQVAVTLLGIDMANMLVGCILCDVNHPVPISTRFRARIVVFNVKVPITIGFPILLHHQSLIEPATIVKLKAQLHKGSGEILKKNPRCLGNNSCALVEIETTRAICIEKYADCKELGRIMLRINGCTIAAGVITDLIK